MDKNNFASKSIYNIKMSNKKRFISKQIVDKSKPEIKTNK